MQTRTKVFIAIVGAAVVASAAALGVARSRNRGVEVRLAEVVRRDLLEVVTASGNIRARRSVDISSDISARVAGVLVREGEDVRPGQVLLRLDPAQYEAGASRERALLSQARARESEQRANLLQARRNRDRLLALRARDTLLVSHQQVDDAETAVEVAEAALASAEYGVSQADAGLAEAEDRLGKTIIRAPIAGKVTRLNVEEGETVIIGTMNNPGSLILTISDLSVVEVVVKVDETDVPRIELGDSASVRIDAFPDRTFTGRVTEIGNSAIQPPSQQAAGQQAAIDFEVVIELDAADVPLRPDLSATADIVTEIRKGALAVPIIGLTVRPPAGDSARAASASGDWTPEDARESSDARDVEGVFVVRDGTVTFTPVAVGIAGREHFEIVSGLSEGDTVVAGPYQRIRELADGDAVKPASPEPSRPSRS